MRYSVRIEGELRLLDSDVTPDDEEEAAGDKHKAVECAVQRMLGPAGAMVVITSIDEEMI